VIVAYNDDDDDDDDDHDHAIAIIVTTIWNFFGIISVDAIILLCFRFLLLHIIE
jgi:hypothetical protein